MRILCNFMGCLALLCSIPSLSNAANWGGHDVWYYYDMRYGYNGNYDVNTNNTVYLYNVGAGKDATTVNTFFNVAGHWGVEASLHEVGIPVYLLYQTYNTIFSAVGFEILTSPNPEKTAGNRVAFIQKQTDPDDNGVMCDRNSEDKEKENGITAKTLFFFSSSKDKGDDEYAVWIWYADGGNYYYLTLAQEQGLRKNVLTFKRMSTQEAKNDPYSKWKIVTRWDQVEAYKAKPADYLHPVDATFYVYDQNFGRNNRMESKWIKKEGTGKININNAKYYIGQTEPRDYIVGTNSWDKELTTQAAGTAVAYNSLYGGFFNAEIKGGTGSISQRLDEIVVEGYYMLTCQGFYKPGDGSKKCNAYLYAKAPNPDDGWQEQVVKASLPLVETIEKGVVPADLTESGIAFFQDNQSFSTKLIIKIDKYKPFEIGVALDEATGTNDWVAIDNIQLKYLGNDYLVSQAFGNRGLYDEKQDFQTLVLMRDFVINKWNTFTLPLDLNKDQVVTAFGNDVKLARLKGLSEDGKTIEFESVKLDEMNWTEKAIEINEPYLILPSVGGREYDIAWTGKPYSYSPQLTKGPKYIIPMTNFDPSKPYEASKRIYNSKGQSVTIHSLQWYHTEGEANGPIQAGSGNCIYAMNKGALTRYTRPFSLVGLTFYLEYDDASQQDAKLNIFDDGHTDNTTTAIPAIDDNDTRKQTKKGIYSIGGHQYPSANSTNDLPAGIYIVDGKKVVVY